MKKGYAAAESRNGTLHLGFFLLLLFVVFTSIKNSLIPKSYLQWSKWEKVSAASDIECLNIVGVCFTPF